MKKYSVEWKYAQQEKNGGWAQKHDDGWKFHRIQYDTEYVKPGAYRTKKECEQANISPDYEDYADQI
jgi:hypothetical protein